MTSAEQKQATIVTMFGVKEFSEDPLTTDRKDLIDYNSKLLQLSSEVDHLITDQHRMNAKYINIARFVREAADPKSSTATESTTAAQGISPAFALFSQQMSQYNHSGENSLVAIEKAKTKIDRLDSRIKTLRADLTDRDRAHALLTHYEVKTTGLQKKYQEKVENGNKSESAKENLDRNLVKFREAQENCDRLDRSVKKDITNILGNRQNDVGEIVEALSRYFASTVTQNEGCVEALTQAIPNMVAKLSIPSTSTTLEATPVVEASAVVIPKVQTPQSAIITQKGVELSTEEHATEPLLPRDDTPETKYANEVRTAPVSGLGYGD
ncbi:hypothetical protein Pmar_PMAR016237 [Perkinsus marinus ATCC 50983]|uniref:Uncharacterized protein n=1 Tax=Perkinsus marinus (strain ATCC 50983 / TXsc) TaxID=423536 RepID=C5KIX6_PERM5|nr:hypothetical protein Pmar_PMAR016237 [Perkinsus marinus ATCC 50983]EER15552.1 hypothetical protein Pmar_PMAR016237 [Perkinsus marinus ATCC 50983]|eukprot:XP_002783756.1 hypothetical protein Pmar_PMAR016237 [Perkinsus marinus ATCC 50983]